jgi:WD40 repeat protein
MRYLLLLSLLCLTVFAAHAQSTERQEYSYCGITVVRDGYALILQDAAGNAVSSYESPGLPHFHPSPDCRFIAATMRFEYGGIANLYVWDAQTGHELDTGRYSIFEWSPDSNRLLLKHQGGVYLWDFQAQTMLTLTTQDINRWHPRTIWSPSRGLLYFNLSPENRAHQQNDETVYAYNWLTGELVAQYTNLASEDRETGVELSADERYLIVYSMHSYPEAQGITVYDVETGFAWKLDSATEEFINNNRQIEISPDGRYLVAANRHLWVWELPLLTDTSIEHTAHLYYGPEAWVENFHFISPNIIETTDSSDSITRWDISNGDPVP